jgi:CTP synthase (UTP-ammonia lyase)
MAKKLNFLAADPGLDVTMPQTKPVPKPIMTQEQIIALIGGIRDLHDLTLKDAQGALRHASIQTTGDVYMQAIEGSVLQALNSRTSEILSDWKPTLVSGGQPINGESAAPKRRRVNLARGLDQNGPSSVLKESVSA